MRFGIITNGELSFQLPKLEAIGLLSRMEHVIASGSFGVAKPDPRIFEHACSVFGVAANEAAYVGDRFETDAVGAAHAGLTGVWVDRLGIAGDDERREAEASGVLIVRTLLEIPQLLPEGR
jgi:putative hydrolase of the HAD superfamily